MTDTTKCRNIKGKYVRPSISSRRDKIALGFKRKKDSLNVSSDHCYAAGPSSTTDMPMEQLQGVVNDESWREGRRVVDLGVLAEALSSCKMCCQPLQLSHTSKIVTYGMSAILKIKCCNTTCSYENNVPTGKRHGRVWDANTKLGTAMLHAGMGGTQVNSFLAALNIPPVSKWLLHSKNRECGDAIETVAHTSTMQSLKEELKLTREEDGEDELTVSVDAGWQKRGSGRSYDSLSGHCSMIGAKTGKVLDYSVRSKVCRVCDSAARRGKPVEDHDCRRN